MSSIIQLPSEESVEQQISTRRRSLFPIKHLLAHLDIDVDEDENEAANLTRLTQNFLSVTKQFSNAEICELSDATLEQYAAQFLETRSTFGESGNATMGNKFWPTGPYEKKLTYAKHPTMIKDNVKLIMVNQRDNKRATFAKRTKRRRNEAAEKTYGPEGSISSPGSAPENGLRSSSTAENGARLPSLGTVNIPIILESPFPASASRIERSVTPDGLPSPISCRSPSPNFVDKMSPQQNAPKRRRCVTTEPAKSEDGENGKAGTTRGPLGSADMQSRSGHVQSPEERALIDACHSSAWDAGVFAIQLLIERYQAETRRAGAEAETAGNDRKRLNCDHRSDALEELLLRVYAEKKKKEEKMKTAPHSWFNSMSTHRRASSASALV